MNSPCTAWLTNNSIWLLYFVNAFQSSIIWSLVPFVTSDFESHSLLNVIYIVANAMTAAVYIPLSKVLDVWGRAEGFAIMSFFATLGLVLMAACQNLATFCAAYVRFPLRAMYCNANLTLINRSSTMSASSA